MNQCRNSSSTSSRTTGADADADGESRAPLRVRRRRRSKRTISSRTSIRRTGTMVFRERRRHVRAGVDSPRSQHTSRRESGSRTRPTIAGWCAARTASSTPTRCGRAARGCSDFTRPSSSTTCCRPASRRRGSGERPPFRRVDGYPSGLLDPGARVTVGRRGKTRTSDAVRAAVQRRVQYELMPDVVVDIAYVGNKGTKLNGFRNLNQRAVITNPDGSQSAGARPYPRSRHPVDGDRVISH